MKHVLFPALSLLVLCSGCYGETIEPGHRGLLFEPRSGGLSHEVLSPGYHSTSSRGRVDDFDVTYSTKTEAIHALSSEGLGVDLRVAVRYRPIVSELYELDTEVGQNYYDEVIGPEFRSASRGVLAHHSYVDLTKANEKVEDEIETDLRRRTQGRHLEITAVTLEQIEYAPEIAAAVRSRVAGEQEAAKQKAQLENEALRKKLEIERADEEAKLQSEASLRQKKTERALNEEQAEIDKKKAEVDASIRVTTAKATAEETKLLAKADAEKHKAEVEHHHAAGGTNARVRRARATRGDGDDDLPRRLLARAAIPVSRDDAGIRRGEAGGAQQAGELPGKGRRSARERDAGCDAGEGAPDAVGDGGRVALLGAEVSARPGVDERATWAKKR